MAFLERNDRFLGIAKNAGTTPKNLPFALANERVHSLYLDAEQALDGRFDFRLLRGLSHVEDDLIGFRKQRRLFSDDGRQDDIISLELHWLFSLVALPLT